jgi:mRNA-degrading endonuclease RelE of RelBE toxin-antitoxin system
MLPLRLKLEYSSHFLSERKKYVKNSLQRFTSYKKTITIFASNPNHSSLNVEKLRNAKGVYTIRLSRSDRIFFVWKEENTVLFIDIGKHDKYRRF